PYPTPAPTQPYTLSLHDALPSFAIFRYCSSVRHPRESGDTVWITPVTNVVRTPAFAEATAQSNRALETRFPTRRPESGGRRIFQDRKSTRLNSSHRTISYAVFCL